ncbi:histidine phosphatase family protein [Pseudomonas sp.]|uniref:histidine phosphatase family protein n=1 Tax=Pseudomonas sp. TaxID=306 RepID=UPI0025F4A983|nr:phosphoglycerate mutase family protein [Pseudomonas sp.]
MGILYLVRHGQASLGAADYDQLSALGHRQAVCLSEHWREQVMRFDALVTGTLRRHGQTWDGIAEGLALLTCDAQPWLGFNEYDSDAVRLDRCRSPTCLSCAGAISACCATAWAGVRKLALQGKAAATAPRTRAKTAASAACDDVLVVASAA